MALYVQKFGGTSVGSLDRIQAVADKIVLTRQAGHQVVVVLSAMADETNRLIDLAHQVDSQPSRREMDVLMSVGEQISISLLSMALIKRGYSAISMLADQIGIATDSQFGRARIVDINANRLSDELEQGRIVIVAGFQGRDHENNVTTLGRGGSDTTAVAVAAALKADECQIYTDVDGVYTADPRMVSNARLIKRIDFTEMLELSALGAKVLQNRAVELAGKYKVPLRVLSSFEDEGQGTLICYEDNAVEQLYVSGVTYRREQALIELSATSDVMLMPTLLSCCQEIGVELDQMMQHTIQEPNNIPRIGLTLSLDQDDASLLIDAIQQQNIATVNSVQNGLAKVSVVGLGVKSHPNVSKMLFSTLADEGIKTLFFSSSEITMSVILEDKYTELAVRSLHDCYDKFE